jgi:hypothetical protein
VREFDLADVRLGEIVFVGPTAGPLNIDTIPKTTHPRKIGTSDRWTPPRSGSTRLSVVDGLGFCELGR